MKPTLTEQLAYCDRWLVENKPVEWPSMRVRLEDVSGLGEWYVATWTRGTPQQRPDRELAYEKVIRPGHWSVLEFSWYVHSITGVSRICTHELVRHRALSYCQESTRVAKSRDHVTMPADCWAQEHDRYDFGGYAQTSILVAGNGRAWAEMLRKRLCLRAAPEIRWLAYCIAKDLREISPLVYACAVPDCNKCEERSCS